ncbi:MAG: DUF6122 family protein [Salegentibacter sp.]
MLQPALHYFLHLIAIGGIAYIYDRKHWKRNWLILLATMLVDVDHLFATPIFDPHRCGIGFHPLHSEIAIALYFFGILLSRRSVLQLIFIGLFFHMLTDFIDCMWTFSACHECYLSSELHELFQKITG